MMMVLTAVLAVVCAAAGAYLYRRGLKDGLSVLHTGEVEKAEADPPALTEEEKAVKELLAAIDSYDGLKREV